MEALMLLAPLLACAGDDKPALAGWRVTMDVFNADGSSAYEQVNVYDDDGRSVSVSTTEETYSEEGTTTWDGDCPVRAETTRHTEGPPVEDTVTTSETACDDEGDPVHTKTVALDTWDGVDDEYDWDVTYENTHDDTGRLVRTHELNSEGYGQVRSYGWGACDDPVFDGYRNDPQDDGSGGDSGLYQTTCDDDGKRLEVQGFTFDVDGRVIATRRAHYRYDAFGREISVVTDSGPGTDTILEYAMFWDDPTAPGPTLETLTRNRSAAATFEFTYERAE
jgi:hypothetical protein